MTKVIEFSDGRRTVSRDGRRLLCVGVIKSSKGQRPTLRLVARIGDAVSFSTDYPATESPKGAA